ncbi:MAG TPA: hypothetical protein VE987_02540 [Polyangiaceae bacterium]|nr:hypothetical protein [Polyangiaceae bacterium]
MRSSRGHWLVLPIYAAIVAGTVMRFQEAYWHNPIHDLFSDPLRHWTYGQETLSPQPWAMVDPPLFQMWLSLVQKWSLGFPPLVAAYAGALSAVTPWLWYRFLRLIVRSRALALLGWAALAWLPSWTAIFRYFMTETLLLPLMGASLWQTMRADRQRDTRSFAWMVLLWSLAGMTRGIAVPLGGLAGLWVWLRRPKKVRNAAAAVAVVLVLAVPIAVRNHQQIGLWSPLGTGWPNQIYAASGAHDIHLHLTHEGAVWNYEFGSPSLYARQLQPLSDWEPRRQGVVTVSIDLTKGAADWRAAYERSALKGWPLLRLRWENLVLVMLGESWPDKAPDCAVSRAALGMRWIWAPFLVVVAAAAAWRRATTRAQPLVPLLIGAWFALQAMTLLAVNEGRYRKPLEGLLIVEALVLLDGTRLSSRWLA